MLLIPGEEAQGILGWCSGRRPKIRTSWPPLGRSSQPSPHIHTALFPPTSSSIAQIRNTQIHSFRMEIRKVQLLPLWKLSTDWRPVAAGGVVPVLPLRGTRTCWRVSWSGALQEIRISFIWSAGKYRKYLFLVSKYLFLSYKYVFGLLEIRIVFIKCEKRSKVIFLLYRSRLTSSSLSLSFGEHTRRKETDEEKEERE